MVWSNEIDTIIQNSRSNPITVSYTLEIMNGYQATWFEIPISQDGFDLVILDGNPVQGTVNFRIPLTTFLYMEEFNRANPIQLGAAIRFKCTVLTPSGYESGYLFRGFIKTKQTINMELVIQCCDWLEKMNKALAGMALESDKTNEYIQVSLAQSPNWDPAGEIYTFEVERVVGNNFAFADEDWAAGTRRSWVPRAFLVERNTGFGFSYIDPSEFEIDTAMGLIRFFQDQAVAYPGATYRIEILNCYIEGTLDLANVIEEVFMIDNDCATLGMDAPTTLTRINLTGTLTFTWGSTAVTGIGAAFTTELSPGDRITNSNEYPVYGIVDSITNDNLLVLRYKSRAIIGGAAAGWKSTFRSSGISITNINWLPCDGSAADLYRKLQDFYADSRGYKVWFDHYNNKIIGDRVQIDITNAIPAGPLGTLRITETLEDFATAVATKGIVARSQNLMGDAAVVITDLILSIPPEPVHGWIWTYRETLPQDLNYLKDLDFDTIYSCLRQFESSEATEVSTYFDFVEIDLGAVYQLGSIIVDNIDCKNAKQFRQGISIYGRETGGATPWEIINPNCYKILMNPDERKTFDCESTKPVRYLKIQLAPFKWQSSGDDRTVGLREIQVYGTQTICQTVCIQGEVACGFRAAGTGTITFEADGIHVSGVGTNFGGAGEPVVGDWIALTADQNHFGIIETINAPVGVNCVTLRYPYGGTPGANGIYVWTDSSALAGFVEGQGGHLIGGMPGDANFIRDYYPDLVHKLSYLLHLTKFDDSGVVLSEMQALDRAYILLNEFIRLYREIHFICPFDPRVQVFQTYKVTDDYRQTGPEDLYFLVQSLQIRESQVEISGIEYGAGVPT